MAGSVNSVTLVGRVGHEPRESKSRADSVSFSLATSEQWRDGTGWMQERTDWHRVRCWGRLADVARSWIDTGDMVCIDGRIAVYEVEDGERKGRVVEIVAERLLLLSPKRRTEVGT